MDLSQLSDEELQKIASGTPPDGGLSGLSDAELEKIAGAPPSGGGQASYDPQLPVINEQHPDISWADRFLAKNFANDNSGMAAYLKKENPGLDIQSDGKRVLIRKPGEPSYKVLDPDTGVFSKDIGNDITDAAWSIGSGALQGLGTAAGAIAGAPTGPGAVPAAMGAGAAVGSAAELARQGIGGTIGAGGFSGGDLAAEGIVGGLGPLLFGSGAPAKELLKATGKEALNVAERGLVPAAAKWGVSRAAPKVHEFFTGLPADVTRHAYENLDKIKTMEQDPNFVRSFAQETQEMVQGGLSQARRKVGKEFEMGLKESPSRISMRLDGEDSVLRPLDDLLRERSQAASQAFSNPAINAEQASVEKLFDNLLVGIPVNESNELTPYAAFQLRKRLEAQAKPFLTGKAGQDVADNELGAAIKQTSDRIDDAIKSSVAGNKQLAEKYSFLRALEKESSRDFSTPEATFRTLRTLGAPSKGNKRGLMGEIDREIGGKSNISDRAKDLQALMTYGGNVATEALGSRGVTSTSRSNKLGYLGSAIAGFLGHHMGVPAPALPIVGAAGYNAATAAGSPAAARYGVMEPANAIGKYMSKLPETDLPLPQMLSDAAAFEYVRDRKNRK